MFPFIISIFLCTYPLFFPPLFHLPLVISSLLPWQFLLACSQALKPAFLKKFVRVFRSESPLLVCSLSHASLGPKLCTETAAQKHKQLLVPCQDGKFCTTQKELAGFLQHIREKYFPLHLQTEGVLFPALPWLCWQSQFCFWAASGGPVIMSCAGCQPFAQKEHVLHLLKLQEDFKKLLFLQKRGV